ncbi:flagellar protein FlaF [Loktanella fryxellensis]|uniref:Flagellar protein FlaF n=1 Tax=Loktanella fryxellensis TaxID=245187 RepID=A0A1H7ZRC9_9RHOB|nr:flagellar biosynthesis regulator FlaF [Loktanella fryxellensis]SEM60843.1 flagellar protein FlaF [Loktanella fryxellensis]
MNAILKAQNAYAPAVPSIQTPRAIELRILTSITARLSRTTDSYAHFAQAIHDNRCMWTALAVDVADSENGLSASLRAQIFYLAEFVSHHSARVLRGEASAAALIDVNTSIIRGLHATGRV